MVNEINEIMDENDKNSFNKFLAETIIKIVQYHHIPTEYMFLKANHLKKHKILESMNINGIIAMLGKIEHQLDPLYNHLLGFFNAVVKNYNSNNPPVLQKSIST